MNSRKNNRRKWLSWQISQMGNGSHSIMWAFYSIHIKIYPLHFLGGIVLFYRKHLEDCIFSELINYNRRLGYCICLIHCGEIFERILNSLMPSHRTYLKKISSRFWTFFFLVSILFRSPKVHRIETNSTWSHVSCHTQTHTH